VLARAQELVPCDIVSFTDCDPVQRRDYVVQGLPAEDGEPDPVFCRHYWDCAPCSYPDRSGDLLSVTAISDFYTRQQWHNTGMYAGYFGSAGVEAEAVICLSARPSWLVSGASVVVLPKSPRIVASVSGQHQRRAAPNVRDKAHGRKAGRRWAGSG
jgi:hypothetical protein